jgi:hypothetical protein
VLGMRRGFANVRVKRYLDNLSSSYELARNSIRKAAVFSVVLGIE